MREERRDFRSILEEALRGVNEALEGLSESELVLDEGEERLDILGGRGGYVVIKKPSGDVVAKAVDMLTAEGRLTLPIIEFILSKCLKEYKITAKEKVLDSKTVPKGEKVGVFIKRVPPILLYWVVMQILKHVPIPTGVPTLGGTGESDDEAVENDDDIVPIKVE